MDESQVAGDWLLWVMERRYCLESRIIEAVASPGLAMPTGTVLELKTGEKYEPIGAASGGDAEAILVEPVSLAESLVDQTRLVLIGTGKGGATAVAAGIAPRGGMAVVNETQLQFPTSAAQKAQALAAMHALDIVFVSEPTFTTQTT